MNINRRHIQISGKCEIDQDLKNIDYQVSVTPKKIELVNNEDGTFDKVFKCKLVSPLPKGEEVELKSITKSRSKRHRNIVYRYWEQEQNKLKVDFETYYNLYYDKRDEEILEKLED